MRAGYLLLLLFYIFVIPLQAQDDMPVTLNIGDPAPPLYIREWLKGEPVRHFEKDKVYILEFWATWCAPCRAAMPRLSVLAAKYKDQVTVVSVDVNEMETTSPEKIKRFVDSMGQRMDYIVATDDSNLMSINWLKASGARGIPSTIVINGEGRLAWIGHPSVLEEVLPAIINNTWDINKALATRNENRYLDSLDREYNFDLAAYRPNSINRGDPGLPNLLLWQVEEIVKKEPRLKYAPFMGYQTFASLLQTNPQKAYEYAKVMMVTPTYEPPAVEAIIGVITCFSDSLTIPPNIYQLGAEAIQALIDRIAYPENVDMYKFYSKMAGWYSKADNKSKAIAAQQKAIGEFKSRKGYAAKDLDTLESHLRQYKRM